MPLKIAAHGFLQVRAASIGIVRRLRFHDGDAITRFRAFPWGESYLRAERIGSYATRACLIRSEGTSSSLASD